MNEKFSVIIRTRNEERWVGHTIQSVLDFLNHPEIIVIDDNSNDKTLEIVRRFQSNPNIKKNGNNYTDIKIYPINNYTPGKAINMGVNYASNSNILVISSHCVLKKFDKKKILDDLKNYVGIFGNQIPIMDGKKVVKRYLWSHFVDKEIVNMYSDLEKRFFFHNAFSIFKKKSLIKYPFDEYFSGKEDRYWVEELVKMKIKFLYDPKQIVEHHYTPDGNTWKGLD